MADRDSLYRTERDDILVQFRTIIERRDRLAHQIAGPLSHGASLDSPGMAERLTEYRDITTAYDNLAIALFG